MRVVGFNEEYQYRLMEEINRYLESLDEKDQMLVEIQYSTCKSDRIIDYSAMIIYCEKSEYRELRLGKLLDKTK